MGRRVKRERGRLTDGGSEGNMRLESSDFYLFEIFFLMRTILIVFIDFVTTLLLFLCFDFFFFCQEECGILVPDKGSNSHLPHWKVKS